MILSFLLLLFLRFSYVGGWYCSICMISFFQRGSFSVNRLAYFRFIYCLFRSYVRVSAFYIPPWRVFSVLPVLASLWPQRLGRVWYSVPIKFGEIISTVWRKVLLLRVLILNFFCAMSCRSWINWWARRFSVSSPLWIRPWISWGFQI